MNAREVRLLVHPPERGRRSHALAAAAGCCCCCCCCIHTLGGLIGAGIGAKKGISFVPSSTDVQVRARETEEVALASRVAIRAYWWSVLIVCLQTVFFCLLENQREGFFVALFAIALCLTAGQLVASVFAIIYVNVYPPARKREALLRVGKITLWAFTGSLIGSILLALAFPIFFR